MGDAEALKVMGFQDYIKLALSYAEESSKRARWLVFIIQIAAVLVAAAIWQQSDSNWAFQRLRGAQMASRLIQCEPETYKDALQWRADQRAKGSPAELASLNLAPLPRRMKLAVPPKGSPDSCQTSLSDQERREALQYIDEWNWSLSEATKNTGDLQQLISNRVLSVGVPVLGIVFDVNDLSVMSGITFAILLSWFHFALKRQHKNVKQIFDYARQFSITHLRVAYDLLAMTQVLTVTPGQQEQPDRSLGRRLTRFSNVIVWTAVAAQVAVIFEDLRTMPYGDALNISVSHLETALAAYLLVYIIVRTIQCVRFMDYYYEEWYSAYCELSFENVRKPHGSNAMLRAVFAETSVDNFTLAWLSVCLALIVNLVELIGSGFFKSYNPVLDGMWIIGTGLVVAIWIVHGIDIMNTVLEVNYSSKMRRRVIGTVAFLIVSGGTVSVLMKSVRCSAPELACTIYTLPLLAIALAAYVIFHRKTLLNCLVQPAQTKAVSASSI